MEAIEQVFAELNFPSAPVLKKALAARGIAFDPGRVDQLAKGEGVRQVQAPAPVLGGKVYAAKLHDVWFADLIDLTAAPSRGSKDALGPTDDGERYILTVQDVFSRKLFGRALRSKKPEETREAFDQILAESGSQPASLVVDKGGEFQGVFAAAARAHGIAFATKSSMRHIATLDSAINTLKKAMVRDARKARTDDWAARLAKVIRGQNALPRDGYLEGKAPASVEGSEELQDKLEETNEEYRQHNRERIAEREARLREARFFRTMIDRPTTFARGFKPRWSTETFEVASVNFDEVMDTGGNVHKTKFVLPVAEAETAPPTRLEGAGSAATEARKRRALAGYVDRLRQALGSQQASLNRVGALLNAMGGFRQAALEARLNMATPVASFLRAFPEEFQITSAGGAQRVRARQPPLVPGANRLRRGPRV